MWTIETLLHAARDHLSARAEADSARLDAELLLTHVLAVDRVYLYTHYDRPVTDDERSRYRELIRRRGRREPVSQILEAREFFGRSFWVNRDVLTPRPETEHLVEEVLARLPNPSTEPVHILDVGTGSGAVAVTLAAERPNVVVTAVDVSEPALVVARTNVARFGVADRVHLVQSDLDLALGDTAFHALVSNPPYVRTADLATLAPEVRQYEPVVALDGGPDGLTFYRAIAALVPKRLRAGGFVAVEVGLGQAEDVAALWQAGGCRSVVVTNDLAGHPRIVVGTW